jgi:hypothetical protein
MIKFFRTIRRELLEKNTPAREGTAKQASKMGKYFKYAIGEIILVVIGILIALSINNWNENQKEEKQIRNIYARVVKDFENSAMEIESILEVMNDRYPILQRVMREEVDRDTLLMDRNYLVKHFNVTFGFPVIQIHDKGVRMLESKIGLNYELNTEYSEELILLYSEFLYEIEVHEAKITRDFEILKEYQANRGVRPIRYVNNSYNRIADMIFEDDVFKNHLFNCWNSYVGYKNKLDKFKNQGEVSINKIKDCLQ